MLASINGAGVPCSNIKTALATYCPTAGISSSSSLVAGQLPSRRDMSAESAFNDLARLRQRPSGRRTDPRFSSSLAAIASQLGKAERNVGRKSDTTGAWVRCNKTSDTTFV